MPCACTTVSSGSCSPALPNGGDTAAGCNVYRDITNLSGFAGQPAAAPPAAAVALDGYFAAARTAWNIPGMAMAIVKDDRVVF